MDAAAELSQWLRDINVRRVEIPLGGRLPSGRQLRGIRIVDGLHLGRDKHFYLLEHGSREAIPLTLAETLTRTTFLVILSRYRAAKRRRQRRYHAP